MMGQRIRGLKRVGIYVPGGTAAYPSSVLMNAVPAKIAGVEEIIMCTPPQKDGTPNPNIIAAAKVAGVDRIFLMGGAQAVAALAYGTESVPKVDKIVGPGNIFVATAKKLLYGTVDIDMIAGPSEILIIADKSANPKFLAADLMSQAEHDRLASAILLTDCEELAKETETELEKQMTALSRKILSAHRLTISVQLLYAVICHRRLNLLTSLLPNILRFVVKTQWSMSASLIMPALYFSATTVPNLWATILPVLTMFFRQAARQDFSHLFR